MTMSLLLASAALGLSNPAYAALPSASADSSVEIGPYHGTQDSQTSSSLEANLQFNDIIHSSFGYTIVDAKSRSIVSGINNEGGQLNLDTATSSLKFYYEVTGVTAGTPVTIDFGALVSTSIHTATGGSDTSGQGYSYAYVKAYDTNGVENFIDYADTGEYHSGTYAITVIAGDAYEVEEGTLVEGFDEVVASADVVQSIVIDPSFLGGNPDAALIFSANIDQASAVPEPSIGMFMIAGFAMVAGAFRLTRSKQIIVGTVQANTSM